MYYQKRISEVMKASETSENGLSHEEIMTNVISNLAIRS